MKRRDFIYGSVLSSVGSAWALNQLDQEKLIQPNSAATATVLATWKNEKAVNAAWNVLAQKGSALNAVEAGARIPEADPADTSVGYGGLPDATGRVTLDACIMDELGNAGSVTFLQGIMHPISVARRVMEKTPHVMLSGEGALQFALKEGFVKEKLLTENAKTAWKNWKAKQAKQANHDTIGILAIDHDGNLSGACTTSGWAFKMHGRVGDSPIIGAGLYVDNEVGAVSTTGLGELVMKSISSFLTVELMRQGASPQEACEEAIRRIAKKYPRQVEPEDVQVGIIALSKNGEMGAYALKKQFEYTLNLGGKNQVSPAKHLI
jgi:N4-(beta-N-acetylglucosaminyl)-L-asparaginase